MDTSEETPATGRAVALVLLKEGLRGVWRACQLAAEAVGYVAQRLLRLAWKLRYPLSRLPAAAAAAVRLVLSSKLGRALVAAAASLVCISLHFNRNGGAHVHVSSSLSLIFGLIKLEGTAVVRLGRSSAGDAPASAEPQGDEFRINCPQGLKDHIVRFLEAQAARNTEAPPPWQLSPQKSPHPGPRADSASRAQGAELALLPPPFPATGASPAALFEPFPGSRARTSTADGAGVGSGGLTPATDSGPSAQQSTFPALCTRGLDSPTVATVGGAVGGAAGADAGVRSCGLPAVGASVCDDDVLRQLEMLLPRPPSPYRRSQAAAGALVADAGAEVSSPACHSPGGTAPGSAAGAAGGPLGTSSAGSAVTTPDATVAFGSGSASGSARSTLSPASLASPPSCPACDRDRSHPLPLPPPPSAAAPTAAHAAAPGRAPASAPEPWRGPALLASLGPSFLGEGEGEEQQEGPPLDHAAFTSLMAAAAAYRPSLPPRYTAPWAPPPPPPGDDDDGSSYSAAPSRYGSAASSCYGSAVSSAASTASAAAAADGGGAPAQGPSASSATSAGGLRKSPDSILGLRGMGLEGWHQNMRAWEELHLEH